MTPVIAKAGIRGFLLDNIGRVVTTGQLRDASGGQVQYSRRVRELRQEEGWKISSHKDRDDLKPGEYVLEEQPPERSDYRLSPAISKRLRAQVQRRYLPNVWYWSRRSKDRWSPRTVTYWPYPGPQPRRAGYVREPACHM